MIKVIGILSALFLSTASYALVNDDSDFDSQNGKKYHECAEKAWKDTMPSADQTTMAEKFIMDAKAVKDAHVDAIKVSKEALKTAWMAYPIVRDDVIAAETTLQTEVKPVREAFRDARINVLNLLTADQRKLFDDSFKACIEEKKDK